MWLFEIKKIIDTTVTSQNIIFATKTIFYVGLYPKEINHTHAKKYTRTIEARHSYVLDRFGKRRF